MKKFLKIIWRPFKFTWNNIKKPNCSKCVHIKNNMAALPCRECGHITGFNKFKSVGFWGIVKLFIDNDKKNWR